MNEPIPPKPGLALVRPSLRADASPTGAPSADAAPTAAGDGAPPVAGRPLTFVERLVYTLTRPAVSAPVVLVSLALLGCSLLIRLPNQPVSAHARPASPLPPGSHVPTSDDVARLRALAATATRRVVTNGDDVPRVIATLEQLARSAGFVTELNTRVPANPLAAIPELALHPVILRLQDSQDLEEPAFPRLLDWLRRTRSLDFKVEVASLTLLSLGDGLSSATVELHFLSLQSDAKAAPK